MNEQKEVKTIELTAAEIIYLKTLCYAENKRLTDLCDHAVAHGGEFTADHHIACTKILVKLEGVK